MLRALSAARLGYPIANRYFLGACEVFLSVCLGYLVCRRLVTRLMWKDMLLVYA
jgi:hypothetical protein